MFWWRHIIDVAGDEEISAPMYTTLKALDVMVNGLQPDFGANFFWPWQTLKSQPFCFYLFEYIWILEWLAL